MKIDFANLKKHTAALRGEIDDAINRVISNSSFILGPEVEKFEHELQTFCEVQNAITCSSGTDALLLSLMALGIKAGDEVITSPFTFIASSEVIERLGAIPVFVDIDPVTFTINPQLIKNTISNKTKVIMPISLYGQTADMKLINDIADQYNIDVIEDGAQSFGATYFGKKSGTLSKLGCTSFFPAKPLGCFGDGGAIFCSDDKLSKHLKSLRVHGQTVRYIHENIGIGGRLDAIQAAILSVKLKYYHNDIEKRNAIAQHYSSSLSSIENITLPKVKQNHTSVWAQYTIRVNNRDKIRDLLNHAGIPSAVHYPKPLHLQPCFSHLNYKEGDFPEAEKASAEVLSLPMNPSLEHSEVELITESLKKALGK